MCEAALAQGVLSEDKLAAARVRARQAARGALIGGFGRCHAEGLTVENLAERMGRSVRWVRLRLFGSGPLGLDDMADLALAMGGELDCSAVPLRQGGFGLAPTMREPADAA